MSDSEEEVIVTQQFKDHDTFEHDQQEVFVQHEIPLVDITDEDDELQDEDVQVLDEVLPSSSTVQVLSPRASSSSVEPPPSSASTSSHPSPSSISFMPPPPPPPPLKVIPCINHRKGCSKMLSSNMHRNKHLSKCIYSVLNECKHPKCVAAGFTRFNDWNDLVAHTVTEHKCLKVKGNVQNQNRIFVNVKRNEFFPKEKDFSSKVLALYEQMVDGQLCQIAFMLFTVAESDKVFMLPVFYGNKDETWHFVRLKLCLTVQNGEPLSVIEPLPHQSHVLNNEAKIYSRVFNPGKSLYYAITNKQVLQFQKQDFLRGLDDRVDASVQVGMSITTFSYRCTIKMENELDVLPFLLTAEEMVGVERLQTLMQLKGEEMKREAVGTTGVVLPQLRAGYNLFVQTDEFKRTLSVLFAMMLETNSDANTPPPGDAQKRRPTSLILFPSNFMLEAIGNSIVQMAKDYGLVCTIFKSHKDEETVAHLITDGCDVILTCSKVFSQLYTQKKPTLPNEVAFENLKFLLLLNSDYIIRKEERIYLKTCFQMLREKVNFAELVKVIVTPLLCHTQNNYLKFYVLNKEKCLSIFLGPRHTAQLKPLPIFKQKIYEVSDKVEMVIKIIRTHVTPKRWLILASEDDLNYRVNFTLLTEKLTEIWPEKAQLIVQRDEATHIDPTSFRVFETGPDLILLTSYYSIHYDAVINNTDGVIVFALPRTFADFMRIVPLVKTLNKPVHVFRDGSSLDKLIFGDN